MRAQLIKAIQDLRASYWFIPACLTLGAILLSILTYWIDTKYATRWLQDYTFLTRTRADGARAVLSVIAGSIMGVAGVTFSITMVAVSFASSNFGPRLIGNFMRDRGNQTTLGLFIGTFVYCLLVLRSVRIDSPEDTSTSYEAFVPHISILVALVLALVCVAMLIFFIHHIPETINVGNIASNLGKRLRRDIVSILKQETSNASVSHNQSSPTTKSSNATDEIEQLTILATQSGYVQTVSIERLDELTRDCDRTVDVLVPPGEFVCEGEALLSVFSAKQIDDTYRDQFKSAVAIGDQRTIHQNALFVVEQLAEIIARALSPGVNDPFTAIACLNWIKVGLIAFIDHDHEERSRGTEFVRIKVLTFDALCATIFDQIRQYVSEDRNVSLHTAQMLKTLRNRAQLPSHISVINAQSQKLDDAMRAALPSNTYNEIHSILKD